MHKRTEFITMSLSGVYNVASQREALQTLRKIKGVSSAAVDRQSGTAFVSFRPEETTVDTLTAALTKAGYPVV